jgi:hypothetical protein
MWARIGPAAGIVSWVVIFTGFFVHGYPSAGASPQELVRWASTTDANRFVAGVFVEDIGWVLFLLFLAWLCEDLWRTGGTHWLLALALASAVVWGGITLGVNGMFAAVLDAGKRGIDPQALAGMRDIAQGVFNSTNIVFGLAMVALGLGALSARTAPRWLGWIAIAIGVGTAAVADVPSLSGPIILVPLVWTVAVAVGYLIRSRAPAAAAPA